MKERYFSHDANARSDLKVVKLRRKYGMEGYGVYFALLEMMYSEPDHALPYTDDEFEAIAYDLHVDASVSEMIAYCVDIGLFETDGETFWSESFRRRMRETEERAAERSKRAANAVSARWERRSREIHGNEQKPPETPPAASQRIDSDWERVAREYMTQIGDLPFGRQMEKLNSYYEDMGADVLIEAIRATNEAAPNRPTLFLLKILEEWAAAGVNSVEKAKAEINEHNRAVRARTKQPDTQPGREPYGNGFVE